MLNLINFKFKDSSINLITINEKPYFLASEVARVLGYSNIYDAISRHCKGVVKYDVPTNGGVQKLNFIPESDVYRLTMRSKLESAIEFQDWVVEEVLPSIRKTGGYDLQNQIPKTFSEALRLAADLQEENEKQKLQIEQDKPKVDFVDQYVETNGDFSITVGFKQIGIGRKEAFEFLRNNGYIYKSGGQDIAKQKYVDMNLFKNVPVMANGRALTQLKITGKGINYFYNKIKCS